MDNFVQKQSSESSNRAVYFLTHFHGDHYSGLSSEFNSGKIYCSEITKKLVLLKFPKLPPNVIKELELAITHCIHLTPQTTMNVTLFNSHHCPGSVMILFEGEFGRYLHSGDFRFCKDVKESDWNLQMITNSKIDRLFLDTTFLDPFWSQFPSQVSYFFFISFFQ